MTIKFNFMRRKEKQIHNTKGSSDCQVEIPCCVFALGIKQNISLWTCQGECDVWVQFRENVEIELKSKKNTLQ